MNTDRIKNILIMKPGAIGDVLQLTPVIRALRAKYPSAAVSLLVGSSTTAELFKYNPHLKETIIFDRKGAHRSLRSLVELRRSLRRKNRYDCVINFQRSNLKAWFLASAHFPCRILVYHKSRDTNIHAVVNHLDTLSPLGISSRDSDLELHTGRDEAAFAARVLSAFGPRKKALVALNPGASHAVNRWRTGYFAKLADLLDQNLKANVIIIGGPDDVPLSVEIAAKAASKPLVLAGKTTLLQLAALLEQSDVLVSGDTGPMHIASAVRTPVVALFGAADPARTGPVGGGHTIVQAAGVPCVPCRSRTCRNKNYLECMERISPETVFDRIAAIAKPGARPAS